MKAPSFDRCFKLAVVLNPAIFSNTYPNVRLYILQRVFPLLYVMLCMVLIKCSVIATRSVNLMSIGGYRFHQLKVDKQAPGPSVTVNER